MQKIKDLAGILALKNAAQHDGKASSKAVLGSLLGALPEARKDIPQTINKNNSKNRYQPSK